MKKIFIKLSKFGMVFGLINSIGFASQTGTSLDQVASPLEKILTFVQGPLVMILATGVIIVTGLFLMFNQGDNSSLIKKVAMLAIGIAVIILAPGILTSLFGFSGGCLI